MRILTTVFQQTLYTFKAKQVHAAIELQKQSVKNCFEINTTLYFLGN